MCDAGEGNLGVGDTRDKTGGAPEPRFFKTPDKRCC